MDHVSLMLLTSAIWLAPSCRPKFQVFMGCIYLLIAAVLIFTRQ